MNPLLMARVFSYDFLRRVFLKEPEKELLHLFVNKDLVLSFPFVEEDHLIKKGVSQVHGYLKKEKVLDEDNYQNLHWDYTSLFVGPHTLPAPPWESAYLNEERLLFQKETLKVRRAYLKYQFLPKYHGLEADDHIGLELDFMYQLSKFAVDKYEHGDFGSLFQVVDDQRSFLEEHLLKWIPAFCKDVSEHAFTDFYKGMSNILQGFVEIDLLALKQLKTAC